jgi:hypothetical protein
MTNSRWFSALALTQRPICTSCGKKCVTDHWLPFCFTCASREGRKPRRLRLAAEQILAELRAEARAEGK